MGSDGTFDLFYFYTNYLILLSTKYMFHVLILLGRWKQDLFNIHKSSTHFSVCLLLPKIPKLHMRQGWRQVSHLLCICSYPLWNFNLLETIAWFLHNNKYCFHHFWKYLFFCDEFISIFKKKEIDLIFFTPDRILIANKAYFSKEVRRKKHLTMIVFLIYLIHVCSYIQGS